MDCLLCLESPVDFFYEDEKRDWLYFRCPSCGFTFRDPRSFLDPGAEKARYETHFNSIENPGYVRFLSPVVEEALQWIDIKDQGLDFGSGPGPILDQLFARRGTSITNYDPCLLYTSDAADD